ncbi:MAG: YbaN family protein [Lysobacteraceae bacterium]
MSDASLPPEDVVRVQREAMPDAAQSSIPKLGPLRWVWLSFALMALGLGIVGIFVPGLPTVPFVLLASFFAARGSHRLHAWLHRHAVFGPMIRDWEREGAVSRRAKRIALASMVMASLIMAVFAPIWGWVIGSVSMALVAVWLWRRPEPSIH